MLLTATIFAPLLGAIVVMLLPRENKQLIRWVATLFTAIPALLALYMFGAWNSAPTGAQMGLPAWSHGLKFVEHFSWMKTAGVNYTLGVDSFAFLMIALAVLLNLLAAIASWSIEDRVAEYFALFLLLETGTIGVFASIDFVLFYVFWEIVLLPMYFLIGIWGGTRREYAAIKFFLYTLIGSVFMLVAALGVYYYTAQATGIYTFNIIELTALAPTAITKGIISPQLALWLFVGLWVGFAVKVPVWPFHTWLPDAHVEAPTPVSMLLAGILLKMGTYAMLRISHPLLPSAAKQFSGVLLALGLIGIVYAALAAMAQKDFKKMVAYSSVNHMGYFLIGLAAGTPMALAGGYFITISHGLISALFFFVVGMYYERMHTRDLTRFGGMFLTVPVIAFVTAFVAFANLGLPGLAGFIGEFFALAGTLQRYGMMVLVATFGLVIVAAFHLLLMRQTLLGSPKPEWSHGEHKLSDMTVREAFVFAPLAVLIVYLGVYPGPFLKLINDSVQLLARMLGGA